jgi:hypothetical protein
MAGFCAFVFPGLGHLILGKPFQALFWFVLIIIGYFCFIAPGVLLHIVSIVDAARAGRRDQVRVLREGMRR